MKSRIAQLALATLLFVSTQSFAQLRYGPKAGLNIANMSGGAFAGTTPKSNMSFHVGGAVEYSLTDEFCLESGLLVSGKGTTLEMSFFGITATSKISPLYLEIPINALYKVDLGNMKLHLFAGPYIGIGMGGSVKTEVTGVASQTDDIVYGSDTSATLKRTDFGLNLGAGIEVNRFVVRLQYGLGLANIEPTGTSGMEIKNNVFGISLAYMLGDD